MERTQRFISRITTPPDGQTVSRRFWLCLFILFAAAFAYELFRWSRGGGDRSQILFTAGFALMSVYWLSRAAWVRVVSFICSVILLATFLVLGCIQLLHLT